MTDRGASDYTRRNEGTVPWPYDDADGKRVGGPGKRNIKGNLTIGVGHNLEALPLPERIIDDLFIYDYSRIYRELETLFPFVHTLSSARATILTDMAFNLRGNAHGLKTKWPNTMAAMQRGDWEFVFRVIMKSKYLNDVGQRAVRNAYGLLHDKLYWTEEEIKK